MMVMVECQLVSRSHMESVVRSHAETFHRYKDYQQAKKPQNFATFLTHYFSSLQDYCRTHDASERQWKVSTFQVADTIKG
jgi:hypothetical protein